MLVVTPTKVVTGVVSLAFAARWAVARTVDDLSGMTDLLPLGGASVLLVYLLRLISYERQRWIAERAALTEEFRRELADKDADIARREEDHERHLRQWRERYDSLHADCINLYAELRQLRGGRHD